MLLEKTLESPLNFKEIKPVNPKGNQSWIFIRRTDAKAEDPILGPLDVNNRLMRKDPDGGKDWRQEEKQKTEAEMVGRHHRLNGHEFDQALGGDDGQGSLVCFSLWGHKELDMTEQLNSNEMPRDRLIHFLLFLSVAKAPFWETEKDCKLVLDSDLCFHFSSPSVSVWPGATCLVFLLPSFKILRRGSNGASFPKLLWWLNKGIFLDAWQDPGVQ